MDKLIDSIKGLPYKSMRFQSKIQDMDSEEVGKKAVKKIAIIVQQGMVDSVYVSKDLQEIDIEVIDMDTTDCRDAKKHLFIKRKQRFN